MEAFKHLMIGKAPEPTDVYAEMILASGDVGIRVLIEVCQRILYRIHTVENREKMEYRLVYQCCNSYF